MHVSFGRVVIPTVLAAALLTPIFALAHGGGGGHMGGMGGGGHMGGFGGPHVGGGGMPRMPGGLDGGMRGGPGGFDGGRGLDVARPMDGGRSLDGMRELGDFDGAGHFAGGHEFGAGQLSKADFQRIAGGAAGRAGLARDAVRPYSIGALATRGDLIRGNFYRGGWYAGRGWYGDHFNAWWPGGWWGGYGWGVAAVLAWSDLAAWGGYASTPVAYNYGSNVVYGDEGVSVQGTSAGSAEEYAAQAATLADQGASASVGDDDQWRPLGVYALARKEDTNPSTFVSLAIDKEGLLRGTYYDAVSDTTQNIAGKVDKKTQRAAWTIADKKTPVYEAGISNLTQKQTTILMHLANGKVEQMLLVRVDDAKAGMPGTAATDAGGSGT
ncbi:MAG: hypothetical protein O3A37_11100 [Planctomycetota bacterium]|nr:hypothetical protein [Planctomycetota bacterium]